MGVFVVTEEVADLPPNKRFVEDLATVLSINDFCQETCARI